MDEKMVGIFAERMDRHLDEYLLFYALCKSKQHIATPEIPMLWKTWILSELIE